jgi:hypothetical protein
MAAWFRLPYEAERDNDFDPDFLGAAVLGSGYAAKRRAAIAFVRAELMMEHIVCVTDIIDHVIAESAKIYAGTCRSSWISRILERRSSRRMAAA